MTAATATPVESADQLAPEVRDALRALILTLADNKRLLGIRYSDWMLGAPTLEAGIAASSMAQDEWGHGRLTYALLSDFGDEPKRLEHERDAAEYHSIEHLDQPLGSWSDLIATGLLLDTALALQYGALLDSRYSPVHNRVQKLLDEEAYHFQYAAAWAVRLAAAPQVRDEFRDVLAGLLPRVLRWFGQGDSAPQRRLVESELVRAGPDALRAQFLARVAPVLAQDGIAASLRLESQGEQWIYTGEIDWSGWNEVTRRTGGSGPDAETLSRVRGDRDRALLMD